ncbi:MAG: caspase family protein [Chloroflexota bacterium]
MSGKYALIIGNTEYIDPGLTQLTAPGKDAEDFARVLKDQNIGSFDMVTVLVNEPSTSVIEAIDEFFDQKKPDDMLVLYFSGHGIKDEIGSLYLAFKNTIRSRLRSTAIKSDYIREAMDQSRSKRQVLILDCCNSGAFPQGTKAEVGGAMGMVSAFQGYGRYVLTASDATQFAWEGNQIIGETTDNSLFTHFLVKGLEGEADRDGDGKITVDELYDYSFDQIVRLTPKQKPSKSASRQEGDIVLRESIPIGDVKPVDLPDDLISEIEDIRPLVREGAVKRLEKILSGKKIGLQRSAIEALEKVAVDENTTRRVAQAAMQALESVRHAEQLKLQKAEEERKAREDAERIAILRAEDERIAHERVEEERREREDLERRVREKVEAEWKAQEEAKRLASQKAEEERIAKAKLEAERLAEEKRADEKAEIELRAKEETERLARQKAEERIAKAKLESARLAEEKRRADVKAEAERKTNEEVEQFTGPKIKVDSTFKEGLTQIPLATFLITIGLTYLFALSSVPVIITALLSCIFILITRKFLSNRFFIYSLSAYLVSISLSSFISYPYILNSLLAVLAGGSLFWSIFTPKKSNYYLAPYSSFTFGLLLFLIALGNLGINLPFSNIWFPALGLLIAFLIFKRK